MNGVRKWPVRKLEQAVRVINFGIEGNMDGILNAVTEKIQWSKEKAMKDDIFATAYQRPILCGYQVNVIVTELFL